MPSLWILVKMETLDEDTFPPFNYSSKVEQKEQSLCVLLTWVSSYVTFGIFLHICNYGTFRKLLSFSGC